MPQHQGKVSHSRDPIQVTPAPATEHRKTRPLYRETERRASAPGHTAFTGQGQLGHPTSAPFPLRPLPPPGRGPPTPSPPVNTQARPRSTGGICHHSTRVTKAAQNIPARMFCQCGSLMSRIPQETPNAALIISCPPLGNHLHQSGYSDPIPSLATVGSGER